MFRGKESSNRIELSRLVQDLLNIGVLGSLRLGGWRVVGCGWGVVGVPPTHVHMYTHTRMHMHAHIHVKHDNFYCKWQSPLGESLGIPYELIPVHTCVHVCAWVAPPKHPPTTSTHPASLGGPLESVKIQLHLN